MFMKWLTENLSSPVLSFTPRSKLSLPIINLNSNGIILERILTRFTWPSRRALRFFLFDSERYIFDPRAPLPVRFDPRAPLHVRFDPRAPLHVRFDPRAPREVDLVSPQQVSSLEAVLALSKAQALEDLWTTLDLSELHVLDFSLWTKLLVLASVKLFWISP